MTAQVFKSNVVLFPLCDKSGVMLQALQPAPASAQAKRQERSGTRPDAIVFAWVLDLPTQIDSTEAARAVLAVVRPRLTELNAYQRSIVAELTKLMRTEESTWTSIPAQKSARRFRSRSNRRVKGLFTRSTRPIAKSKLGRLVCLPGGRDSKDEES